MEYKLTVVVLHHNVYIRLSVHKENEYSSHLQLLLLTYAHGTRVQDSEERKTSAASLGGLSPNISCYIQSLWYPSGAEPVLALGTGSRGLKLQIVGEQQKTSP